MARRRVSEEKKQLEKVLNEIFGIEISWSRLPAEDLRLLAHILASEDTKKSLCRRLKCPRVDVAELIDDLIPEEHQGPILRGLKKLLGGEVKREEP